MCIRHFYVTILQVMVGGFTQYLIIDLDKQIAKREKDIAMLNKRRDKAASSVTGTSLVGPLFGKVGSKKR